MPEPHRPRVPDPKDWNLDEWILALLAAGALVWAVQHRGLLLGLLGPRLQHAGILLPAGRGLVDVAGLGALDAGRLLIAGAVVLLGFAVAVMAVRRRGQRAEDPGA